MTKIPRKTRFWGQKFSNNIIISSKFKMKNNKEKRKKELPQFFIWLRPILIMLLILAVGFLALNQGMGFFYKIHFLKSPCDLCGELNPEVTRCIYDLNRQPSYWTAEGWTDPFNKSIIQVNITP